MGKLIDLSGCTFGYWTVLNKNEEDTLKYKNIQKRREISEIFKRSFRNNRKV